MAKGKGKKGKGKGKGPVGPEVVTTRTIIRERERCMCPRLGDAAVRSERADAIRLECVFFKIRRAVVQGKETLDLSRSNLGFVPEELRTVPELRKLTELDLSRNQLFGSDHVFSCACDDGWAGPACNTAVNATASKGAAPATAATSAFAAALAVLAGLLLLAAVGAFALAEKRKREVTRYERLVREVGSSASTIITASARDDDEDEERARGSSYAAPEDLALPTFSEMKDISTNISPFHDEPLEL